MSSRRGPSKALERMFNTGDLQYASDTVVPGAVDHQEPPGTDAAVHLRDVVRTLRTAFPDLRFEVHEVLCEGHIVATRSTMTGTIKGP